MELMPATSTQTLTFIFNQPVNCGDSVPEMDTSTVTDPLGKPGVCESCGKTIEEVTAENFLTVRGNRYIVCDDACASDKEVWLSKQ